MKKIRRILCGRKQRYVGQTMMCILVTLVLFCGVCTGQAFAEPYSERGVNARTRTDIASLGNAKESLDGETVVFTGEVVGDIINAEPGYKWLVLQNGEASISVRVNDSDAQKIDTLGRYGQTGTKVEVTGEFQVDCVKHDGLSDVHANELKVIENGQKTTIGFNTLELKIGVTLLVIGLVLILLHRRLRERTR